MAQNNEELESRVINLTKANVTEEVFRVVTAGGNTARIGTTGVLDGLSLAYKIMSKDDKHEFKMKLKEIFDF